MLMLINLKTENNKSFYTQSIIEVKIQNEKSYDKPTKYNSLKMEICIQIDEQFTRTSHEK